IYILPLGLSSPRAQWWARRDSWFNCQKHQWNCRLFRLHRADQIGLSRITQHLSQFGAARFQVPHERRLSHECVRDHSSGNFSSADVSRKVLTDHNTVRVVLAVAFVQIEALLGDHLREQNGSACGEYGPAARIACRQPRRASKLDNQLTHRDWPLTLDCVLGGDEDCSRVPLHPLEEGFCNRQIPRVELRPKYLVEEIDCKRFLG